MKNKNLVIAVAAILVIIALCAVNIYISLTLPHSKLFEVAVDKAVNTQLQQAIEKLPQPIQPKDGYTPVKNVDYFDGKDGTTTVIEKKVEAAPPEKGKDGHDGENGKHGEDGKNGRQVILDRDSETGDIIWRYEGDTLWNLLIEGCEIKGDCQ